MAAGHPGTFTIRRLGPDEARAKDLSPGHTLVVTTESAEDLAFAQRVMQTLGSRVVRARAERQAERIERLVDVLIDEPVSALDEALALDNVALRVRYLETVPTYVAADLHALAASRAANRSALASGWKKEGRVFAVPHRGVDRFPAFQFVDGQPKAVIREVLSALPEGMTPWQIAFWFASGNGWLGDAAPQERLDDPAAIVAAAERMREPTVG